MNCLYRSIDLRYAKKFANFGLRPSRRVSTSCQCWSISNNDDSSSFGSGIGLSINQSANYKDWTSFYHNLVSKINSEGLNSLDDRLRPLKSIKPRGEIVRNSYFIDFANVEVVAGNGGDGCISLASEYLVEFAGPDGADGGNGGHIIFKSVPGLKSLHHIKPRLAAESGKPGRKRLCIGKSAPPLIIEVPLGTIVSYENERVALLDKEGDMFLAAKGGAGGKGNKFFATSVHQSPVVAEAGGRGESFRYNLELRIMADIGLIGFPNAGKSTLLRAVSRARPKVASYPFTTLNPHVGMVFFADDHQMSIADIPGLIKGAHQNLGMGISFLKHIQRCSCLLYVLDGSEEDPLTQLQVLREELEHYENGLSERPHAIVLNKIDLSNAFDNFARVQEKLSLPVIPISAKLGRNLVPLLAVMRLLTNFKQ